MHEYFAKLRNNLELPATFAEAISARHAAVRSYVANNHLGFKESKLIGSSHRRTRIRPQAGTRTDIDILVVMGEFHSWMPAGQGITARAALDALHETMLDSDRYRELAPQQSPPTVEMTYSDGLRVELVPAYRDMIGRDPQGNELGAPGRGYWVSKNGRWEMADYDYEAEYVSDMNAASEGYLIPCIKMLKAIKAQYFPMLGSFPLEILATQIVSAAVKVRKNAGASLDYPSLLHDFFVQALFHTSGALGIPGSKSPFIHLEPEVITDVDRALKAIALHIADTIDRPYVSQAVAGWRTLLPDHFPASV